jgi:hypothetical protein
VEPEKTSVARQRLGKQFPEETNTRATIEELFHAVFLYGPCRV